MDLILLKLELLLLFLYLIIYLILDILLGDHGYKRVRLILSPFEYCLRCRLTQILRRGLPLALIILLLTRISDAAGVGNPAVYLAKLALQNIGQYVLNILNHVGLSLLRFWALVSVVLELLILMIMGDIVVRLLIWGAYMDVQNYFLLDIVANWDVLLSSLVSFELSVSERS